jgi:hypothetical protein
MVALLVVYECGFYSDFPERCHQSREDSLELSLFYANSDAGKRRLLHPAVRNVFW